MGGGAVKVRTGEASEASGEPAAGLHHGGNLDAVIGAAGAALAARQRGDGHWLFELEADATISAEYIVLHHFLDEIDVGEERRIARYLRAAQGEDGGWPLFADGVADLSATIKAYYSLKLAGDDAEAAPVVSVSHLQDFVLVAHGDCAFARPDGDQTASPESARHRRRRALHRAAGERARLYR